MSGIYLHIPFCRQACSYCDFYFVTRTKLKDVFVEALLEEIRSYEGTKYNAQPVKTIYVGGGTPSLLEPDQLERIFDALDDVFELDLQEVTLEMNPDDVTADYLSSLRQLGINRASMGVQSFDPKLLEFMHRAHNREEALHSLELLSQSGFETFTVDLIYGNPDQSLEMLEKDVDTLLSYYPPHVSAYSLTVEPDTRLGKQVELGRIHPLEDELVADHFELINRKFSEQEIHRYEVSNYSRKDHNAVHNSNYWQHENYIGLGPSAHSFWWDDTAERWANKKDLRAYAKHPIHQKIDPETLDNISLAEERLMMGLRTLAGVSQNELEQRYHYTLKARQHKYLEQKKEERKLISVDPIRLSDKGIQIADAIILDLITLYSQS